MMDAAQFESSMEGFFQRAGVVVQKKGRGYPADKGLPDYLLIDVKRNTFYLAETDIRDMSDEFIENLKFEISEITKDGIKGAILKLGRALVNFSPSINLSQTNISGMQKKAALVISEENVELTSKFLASKDIKSQNVPMKGAFTVFFLDDANAKKIAAYYNSLANPSAVEEVAMEPIIPAAPEIVAEPIAQAEPIKIEMPVVEEKIEKITIEDVIAKNIETQKNKPKVNPEDEDKLLESMDLSKIIAPTQAEKEPESEEESALMYSKILNEQAEKQTKNILREPKHRDISDIPSDIKEEISEAQNVVQEEAPAAPHKPLAKLPALQNYMEADYKGSVLNTFKIVVSSVFATIFLTLQYVLWMLGGRFVPAFVLYAVAAVPIFFGMYQYIIPVVGSFTFGHATSDIANAISYMMLSLNGLSVPQSPVSETVKGVILTSFVYFSSFISITQKAVEDGFLLRVMPTFGAILTIFPFSRRFGFKTIIASILSYFSLPFLLKYQTNVLTGALMELSNPSAEVSANDVAAQTSLIATQISATVVILPIVVFVFIYIIAGWMLPDKSYKKRVLP